MTSDLLVQLEELCARRMAAGLRVALTNVAKHSGATSAVARATLSSTELRITVLDQGAGFDASRTPYGVGLASAVNAA